MDTETFEGKIVFGWEITNDCTKYAGNIDFSVRFYTLDELGNFEYNFNTLPAESRILDTLNAHGESEPMHPSSFQVWVDKLYFLEQNCVTEEDLENLDTGSVKELTSVDESISIVDIEGGKDISVAISALNDNALIKKGDGLYVSKVDEDAFGDVVTSVTCGGITAGTSLNGKTVKEVLMMLLGIKEPAENVAEYIMKHQIPAYSGTANGEIVEVEYQLLDAESADYTDQGFYTNSDATVAGYQFTIEGNSNADAQVIAIPANAVIKGAYKHDTYGTGNWLHFSFDTTDEANYWLPGESFTTTINGEEVVYQTYTYNIDVVGGGDAITSTEYWRFEIEVTN
jgi:hypothetical protein